MWGGRGCGYLQSGGEPPQFKRTATEEREKHRSEDRPLRGSAGDEEFQGARYDFEFDGETSKRFAIDLGIDRIPIERLAHQSVGFPEMDAFGFTEIAQKKARQIAEIAEAALRGEGHDLELVFVKIGAGSDLEGAAVVFGASNDGEGSIEFLAAGDDTEVRELVAEHLARALPPVRENANASLEIEINGIDNHAVRAGATDAQKIFFLSGLFERSGEPQGNFSNGAVDEPFGGAGDVPGEVQFLGENIRRAAWKKGEGNTIAVLMGGEAVDDFVQSAVPAAGNNETAAFAGSAGSDIGGMAGAGGFREFGIDAAGRENVAGLIQHAAAAMAAVAGIGIVNQQSVSQASVHE